MKVVVASVSPLLRAILAEALSAAGDVRLTEQVESVAGLAQAVSRWSPQVVLASPALSDGDLYGSVAATLRAGSRVLVVCDAAEAEDASALLFAGATGCLFVQDACAADIVAAVHDVAAGRATLHPAVAASVLTKWRCSRSAPGASIPPPPVALTGRERDVLAALARGLPTKSIGRELGVSPKTVEAHISRLLTKLGARNRAQALAVALSNGLVRPEGDAGPDVA